MRTLSLIPRVSEKAYALSHGSNVYVFDVPKVSSKQEIAQAVEAQFDVSVTSVNVLVAKGKSKRTVSRRGKSAQGSRKDIKRAYVTVGEGDSIPVFAAIDEAEEKAQKAQKAQSKGKK